jgi:hypothetical protein
MTIVFERSDEGVNLIRSVQPLDAVARSNNDRIQGQTILKVDNPLKQNILAALKQRPLVGLDDTCASQLFLEKLHGWRGTIK